MDSRSISVPAGTFHYLEFGPGSGRLVLCLHGFPDHPPSFIPLMQRLADAGFHAVAPWMRGYRPSPAVGPYDMDRLGLDVIELALAFSPDRPAYIIGHDWGAAAVCVAASQAPELFAAAVIMAAPHPLAFLRNLRRHPGQLARSWYMLFFQLPGVAEAVVCASNFALIDRLWRTWSPGYELPRPERDDLIDCLAASMPAPLEYYRALFRPVGRIRARLHELATMCIRVPVLHIHGADDGCIAPEMTADQDACFAKSFRSEIIEGAGHFVHLEAPAEVARLVMEHLVRYGSEP